MILDAEHISINKAIVHILNNREEIKRINDFELEMTEKSKSLLKAHISNSLKNEARKVAKFRQDVNIVRDNCQKILNDDSKFIECSKAIAEYLYDAMSSKSISPANFIMCVYTIEGDRFVGLLKMDFNEIFQTKEEEVNGKIKITITESGAGIPNKDQKLQKCVFFHPYKMENDYDIVILDKQALKSQKEDEISDFFGNGFLHCIPARTDRENTRNFLKYAQDFIEETYEEDTTKLMAAKRLLIATLKEVESFNVNTFAEQLFQASPEIGEKFKEVIANKVGDFTFNVDKGWLDKKLSTRKIKTDNGFEIKGDNDLFENEDKFLIEPLANGRCNIVIKNVKVEEK